MQGAADGGPPVVSRRGADDPQLCAENTRLAHAHHQEAIEAVLGCIVYYHGFIPHIADLTFEMNSMKAHTRLEWTESTLQKFWTLKQWFQEGPIRVYPDYTSPEPFILDMARLQT